MDLKILMLILIYYTIIGLTFTMGGAYLSGFNETYSSTLNTSTLDPGEIHEGNLFDTGVSFARFFGFIAFGVGIPGSVPTWFQIIFSAWQTILFIFVLGWVINSIWSG